MDIHPGPFEPVPPPEPVPPTHVRLGPVAWARANLFSSPANTIVTIVAGGLLAYVGFRSLRYVFVTARWEIVRVNLKFFLVAAFPRTELVRPWIALYLIITAVGIAAGASTATTREQRRTSGEAEEATLPWSRRLAPYLPVVALIVVISALVSSVIPVALLVGLVAAGALGAIVGRRLPARLRGFAWLAVGAAVIGSVVLVAGFGGVGWAQWGGLLLTAFLAVGGIALSFPLGVLLALGRRSSLPIVRMVSVGYIELIRGVPLITLLFMGAFMLGFFFAPGAKIPALPTRALIVMVLFTAAYLAEVVRGGLQSVGAGQREAAAALGLSTFATMRRIVLPQGLRNVIPAIVGQFISLFKDTSLVVTIGMTELLGVAQQVVAQPRFAGRGLAPETLAFAAFLFWVGSYSMSRASQRLEVRLGVGVR